MLWGDVNSCEKLKRDMMAQKFPLKLTKEGVEEKFIHLEGRLCYGALGLWEYCFPKEYFAEVATTLNLHKSLQHFGKPKHIFRDFPRITFLRKIIKCEPFPTEWDTSKKLLWINENTGIIPIGVRYDEDIELNGRGWPEDVQGFKCEGI